MATRWRSFAPPPAGARWLAIVRKAGRGPVRVGGAGRTYHVVLTRDAYDRLAAAGDTMHDTPEPQANELLADPGAGTFNVLCRIDAFADYVAVVEADNPKEAAELAYDDHGAYVWAYQSTAEFDNRCYIALDDEGDEIDGTEIGNF